jgi:hypothetical protein
MDHLPPQVPLRFAPSSAPAVLNMPMLPPGIFILCWTDFGLDYSLVALSELFGVELFVELGFSSNRKADSNLRYRFSKFCVPRQIAQVPRWPDFRDLLSCVISGFSNSLISLKWQSAYVHLNTAIYGNPHCASVMRQKMADSIKRPYFCNLLRNVQVLYKTGN